MTKTEKDEMLKDIKNEIINLKKSPLYKYRKSNNYYPVIGQGNHNADIIFVGEAPGKNEAEQGRPFCGVSGNILNELLSSIKIQREDVYITNILKDRPPGNRDPLPEEIKAYSSFLDRQIEVIKPSIIATLGRFSMEYIMNRYGLSSQLDKISNLHGKIFKTNSFSGDEIFIVPLYHPAVAVYNRNKIDELKKDFTVLENLLKDIKHKN